MKGRKPKDLAMKLLNGNAGKRPLGTPPAKSTGTHDADEEFVRSPLEKPPELDAEASAEWDRLVNRLQIILTKADASLVRLAATTYATIRQCERQLSKGLTYKTKNQHGQVMLRTRPEVGILQQARTQYQRALAELGGSPVARTRVKPLPKSQQQELPGINRFFTA